MDFSDLHTACEGRDGDFVIKFRKNKEDEGSILCKYLNFQDEQKQ